MNPILKALLKFSTTINLFKQLLPWGAPFKGKFFISTYLGVRFLPYVKIMGNAKFVEIEQNF